jgi:hypothetical protein
VNPDLDQIGNWDVGDGSGDSTIEVRTQSGPEEIPTALLAAQTPVKAEPIFKALAGARNKPVREHPDVNSTDELKTIIAELETNAQNSDQIFNELRHSPDHLEQIITAMKRGQTNEPSATHFIRLVRRRRKRR